MRWFANNVYTARSFWSKESIGEGTETPGELPILDLQEFVQKTGCWNPVSPAIKYKVQICRMIYAIEIIEVSFMLDSARQRMFDNMYPIMHRSGK